MVKRLIPIIMFFFLFTLSACATAKSTMSAEIAPGAPSVDMAMPEEQSSSKGFAGDFSSANESSVSTTAADQRIVIRNASLTIVVDDPGSSLTVISSMAEEMGGFVVNSDLHKTYNRNGVEIPEATLTIRVPAEKLNDALTQIKQLVKDPVNDVRAENVTGQDVTKEYTDLNSRLKNYEDAEAQLREIMASATKPEDVLAIFNQLTQVRQEIEVLKGQIQYYQEAAALSSISVQIQAQAAEQPLEVGGWKPVGVARDALQALINTMQFLASAAIWILIYIIPVGLVILLPFGLLVWLIRRGSKNRKKQQQPPVIPPSTPPAS